MRRIVVPLLALAALAGVLAGILRREKPAPGIAMASLPEVASPTPAVTGTLVVVSMAGASVHLDGTFVGFVPEDTREVRVPDLAASKHRLRVAVPHLQAHIEDIDMPAGKVVVRNIPSFGAPIATQSHAEMPSLARPRKGGAILILTEPHQCTIDCATLDWSDRVKLRRWQSVWNVPPGMHVLRFVSGEHVVERKVRVEEGQVTKIGVHIPSGRDLDVREPGIAPIWDPDAGKEVADRLAGVVNISICADGSRAVSCDSAWRVRLWEIGGDRPIEVAQGQDVANKVAISLAGGQVAASDFNHRVWVWDVATQTRLATFDDTKGAVMALAISHDGRIVAALDSRGSVFVWDVFARRLKWTQPTGSKVAEDVAFSPDGALLAVAKIGDRPVQLYRVADGTLLRSFGEPRSVFARVAVSADPPRVVAVRSDGLVNVWNGDTGDPDEFDSYFEIVRIAYSPHGILSQAIATSLVFLRHGAPSPSAFLRTVGDEGLFAISADGRRAAVGDARGEVRFLEVK